jgi:hypothetical protein
VIIITSTPSKKTVADNRSRAIARKHKDISKMVEDHAFHLGAIDEAVKSHEKHISRGDSGKNYHEVAEKHCLDISEIATRLEKSAQEQVKLAAQLRALSEYAKEGHRLAK